MVEHGDAIRAFGRCVQSFRGAEQLVFAQRPALVPVGAGRVQADNVQRLGRVRRLGRLPLPLEFGPRPREAGRERVREVVIPRHCKQRCLEGAEKPGGVLVLLAGAPVGEIARGDDQLRADPTDEGGQGLLDLKILTCTRVKIGYMEEACRHDRMRL